MVRVQNATAAHRVMQLVQALDTQLAALRPRSDQVAQDSPEGLVWSGLVDAVSRCALKAGELTALSAPSVGTKRVAGSDDE